MGISQRNVALYYCTVLLCQTVARYNMRCCVHTVKQEFLGWKDHPMLVLILEPNSSFWVYLAKLKLREESLIWPFSHPLCLRTFYILGELFIPRDSFSALICCSASVTIFVWFGKSFPNSDRNYMISVTALFIKVNYHTVPPSDSDSPTQCQVTIWTKPLNAVRISILTRRKTWQRYSLATSPPWNQFTRVYHPPQRTRTHASRWPPLSAMGRPLPPAHWVSLLPAGFHSRSVMQTVTSKGAQTSPAGAFFFCRPPQGFAASNDAWHIPALPDIGKGHAFFLKKTKDVFPQLPRNSPVSNWVFSQLPLNRRHLRGFNACVEVLKGVFQRPCTSKAGCGHRCNNSIAMCPLISPKEFTSVALLENSSKMS